MVKRSWTGRMGSYSPTLGPLPSAPAFSALAPLSRLEGTHTVPNTTPEGCSCQKVTARALRRKDQKVGVPPWRRLSFQVSILTGHRSQGSVFVHIAGEDVTHKLKRHIHVGVCTSLRNKQEDSTNENGQVWISKPYLPLLVVNAPRIIRRDPRVVDHHERGNPDPRRRSVSYAVLRACQNLGNVALWIKVEDHDFFDMGSFCHCIKDLCPAWNVFLFEPLHVSDHEGADSTLVISGQERDGVPFLQADGRCFKCRSLLRDDQGVAMMGFRQHARGGRVHSKKGALRVVCPKQTLSCRFGDVVNHFWPVGFVKDCPPLFCSCLFHSGRVPPCGSPPGHWL